MNQYVTESSLELGYNLYWIISIIIFGAVFIFVAKMIYNFIKAYKVGNADYKTVENKSSKGPMLKGSIKQVKNVKKEKICVYCGKNNDLDSKFCNNCGKRMP